MPWWLDNAKQSELLQTAARATSQSRRLQVVFEANKRRTADVLGWKNRPPLVMRNPGA